MTALLPLNLERLSKHCSTGTARYATTGVYLSLKPDGTYVADATDCTALIRVTGPCETGEYPTLPALETAPNGRTDAIIPASLWGKAFGAARKLTKKRGVPQRLQQVAVKMGDAIATLASTDGAGQSVESGQHVDGRFPNCTAVIPEEGTERDSVWVNPLLLADVLRTAAEFCSDDKPTVVLETRGDGMLTVQGLNRAGGQQFLAVVMPMSRPDGRPSTPVAEKEPSKEALIRKIGAMEQTATLAEERILALEREVAALRAAAPSLTCTVPAA